MTQMHLTSDELRRRFNYHPADTDEKVDAHQQVRATLYGAAEDLVTLTGPQSREQSLAVTHLEEAMFWANAAIARSDGPAI